MESPPNFRKTKQDKVPTSFSKVWMDQNQNQTVTWHIQTWIQLHCPTKLAILLAWIKTDADSFESCRLSFPKFWFSVGYGYIRSALVSVTSCQLNQWQARKPVKTNWSCRALATYKLQTPFTAVVQKPETRKMNEFLNETIFFFIFCFSFLLFVFKFRATRIVCFSNNRKYKSDRMLNFSLMSSAFARKASCCSWPFAILGKFLL